MVVFLSHLSLSAVPAALEGKVARDHFSACRDSRASSRRLSAQPQRRPIESRLHDSPSFVADSFIPVASTLNSCPTLPLGR